jgi:hypothetical protein
MDVLLKSMLCPISNLCSAMAYFIGCTRHVSHTFFASGFKIYVQECGKFVEMKWKEHTRYLHTG